MVKQPLEVNVEKVIAGGDGLARLPDGKVLFVPFSLPKEKLRVRIIQEKKDYAVAGIEQILETSPDRVKPRCLHFGVCGGCQLQHVSYEGEMHIKEAFLQEILSRQANLNLELAKGYASPKEWEYRTKSEHPVAAHKPKPFIGYYRTKTHKVMDVKECPVLDPYCVDGIKRLRHLLAKSQEPLYNELTGEGNLRHVVFRRSSGGKRLLGLVTRTDRLEAETLRRLIEEFSDLEGIVHNVNSEPGNRIIGDKSKVISGTPFLVEEIAGLKLKVSFESFFQANHAQAERIVQLIREFLEPQAREVLCDAYAGVGMIGLALARKVKKVVAIESSHQSVEDGRHNAEINGLGNVSWLEGDAGELLSEVRCDLLVLDPPRKGLEDKVILALSKMKPKRICYVSCNPATWARDLKPLMNSDYMLNRLAWLDMFPKTAHVEIVSLLEMK